MQNASRVVFMPFLGRCFLAILLLVPMIQAAEKPIIDFSGFDRAVRPQDDFFDFVNGGWLKNTPIPADKTRWGSFVILAEESRAAVQAILDELRRNADLPYGSDGQKLRDLYRSYLDEDRANALGPAPIAADLKAIAAIQDKNHFGREWAAAKRLGLRRPLSFWVDQDSKESTRYAVYFTQSGLGLPDRDYYFQEDQRFKTIQQKYREMLAKLFTLAGLPNGETAAERVYRLEKSIAKHHWTRVENRDRIKTYNKKSLAELRALLPGFHWNDYLGISGIAHRSQTAAEAPAAHFVIRQPSFLEGMRHVF